MNEEIWRPIEGYEGLYEVSSYGKVRSLDKYDSMNRFLRGRILRLFTDGLGYLRAQLYSNSKRKSFLVHRLVAQAFLPNPDNLPQVNHIDENPSNDNVDNLEWCDGKYNVNYGTRIDRIRDIRLKNGTYTGLSKEEYRKKYYQENNDKIKEYRKEYSQKYYQENKDRICERQKKYYQDNKDKICEQQRTYYLKKKEQIQNNV